MILQANLHHDHSLLKAGLCELVRFVESSPLMDAPTGLFELLACYCHPGELTQQGRKQWKEQGTRSQEAWVPVLSLSEAK